jgi:hypothetical protein
VRCGNKQPIGRGERLLGEAVDEFLKQPAAVYARLGITLLGGKTHLHHTLELGAHVMELLVGVRHQSIAAHVNVQRAGEADGRRGAVLLRGEVLRLVVVQLSVQHADALLERHHLQQREKSG